MSGYLPGLCSLCLVFSLTGCAAAIVGGAAPVGNPAGHGERTAAEYSSDAGITSAINARYVADDLVSAFDVHIMTYRGTVTLSGNVRSTRAAQRAVELARSAQGVRRVVSKLTVSVR